MYISPRFACARRYVPGNCLPERDLNFVRNQGTHPALGWINRIIDEASEDRCGCGSPVFGASVLE